MNGRCKLCRQGMLPFALLCLIGCLVVGNRIDAQCVSDSLAFIDLPVASVRTAALDHLDNIYVVTEEQALEKYGRDGRLQKRYANNRLGRITAIDVSNPLKVLIWYGDFRTAVFLDRSLTMLGQLDLLDGRQGEVRAVGAARDGNLWIYDDAAFTLRKIDPEGRELYVSQALNLLLSRPVQVSRLIETDDELLALTPSGAMLHFNLYAQFRGETPAEVGLTAVGAYRGQLYYRQEQPDAVVARQWTTGQRRACLLSADASWLVEPGFALRHDPAGWRVYFF